MRGDQARHCAFLLVLVICDIPRKVFKLLSKNLQKPGKLYCVTVFCVLIWVITIPFSHQYFIVELLFLAFCITLPEINRTISIASSVLLWQYVTYASSCIMTKASCGYHLWCTHFVYHILGGVWLFALPKAEWGKSSQGGWMSALKLFSVLSS